MAQSTATESFYHETAEKLKPKMTPAEEEWALTEEISMADQGYLYSGKRIVRDMRRHRITIRQLALRMDLSQVRVRQVRAEGVTGVATRDWFEAIRRIGVRFEGRRR